MEQVTAQHITSAIVLQVTVDRDDQRKFHVVLHRIFDHKNQRQLDLEQDNVEHQKEVLPLIISFKYEVTDEM